MLTVYTGPMFSGKTQALMARLQSKQRAHKNVLVVKPALDSMDVQQGSEAVLSMLRRSNQEFQQTVLMITHNPEAAEIGDRILHMRDGHLFEQSLEAISASH